MTWAPRRAAYGTAEAHKTRDLTDAWKDMVRHSTPSEEGTKESDLVPRL